MCLRLCRTCTNSAPTYKIRDISCRKWIKKFCCSGNSESAYIDKKLACNPQSWLNIICSIEVWIIDQSFPSYCRTWLLPVCTHHYLECISEFISPILNISCIFECCNRVMDRARSDYNEEPRVLTTYHRTDCTSRVLYSIVQFRSYRKFLYQLCRRKYWLHCLYRHTNNKEHIKKIGRNVPILVYLSNELTG